VTDPTERLSAGLRAAVDDDSRPVDPRALLARAHRRRRARRTRAVALGSAAAVLGVVAAVTLPGVLDGSVSGGSPDPAPAAPTATDAAPGPDTEPLSDREVVRRCRPQLAKYAALPQYGDERRVVAHDRDYRVGDLVLLHSGRTDEPVPGVQTWAGANPVLCEVPAAGAEDEPVPFARFDPDPEDEQALLERCAEEFRPAPDAVSTWRDLRAGEVRAYDATGPVVTALVALGRRLYSCSLSPIEWDAGPVGIGPAGRGPIALEGAATGIKSDAGVPAAYYYGAGTTDPAARSLRITLADGRSFERPVGPGGTYAVNLRVPGSEGVLQTTVDVLDADGRTLATYAW
jgi:hypothetical protein